VLDVPYIQQKDINGCGAAALLMVYQYYGKRIFSEANILNALKRPAPQSS
jgi:ABC-type bacteriocin/lantibiotic exporter with double-glycine peptidase domain